MRGALAHLGTGLPGLTVAVQGTGAVGARLCELLRDAGARLVVADVDAAAAAAVPGAEVVDPRSIHAVEADVLAPCALGGTLNAGTIPEIRARVVAGAANNQLATPQDDARLAARGITYVPDFLASAGGVTNGVSELDGYDRADVEARIEGIAATAEAVLAEAQRRGIPTGAGSRGAGDGDGDAMSGDYPRDMVGYGRDAPHPRWPQGARIAIQIAVNYEAGAESSVLHGDRASEGALTDTPFPPLAGERNALVESAYEYGSRVGIWRLLDMIEQRAIKVSLFGVVQALERNPEVASRSRRPATRSSRTGTAGSTTARSTRRPSASSCAGRSRASSASPASGRSAG